MKALTRKRTTKSLRDMAKEWLSIRIEKNTGKRLDAIHILRHESYNDIILRLIEHWDTTHDKKE